MLLTCCRSSIILLFPAFNNLLFTLLSELLFFKSGTFNETFHWE